MVHASGALALFQLILQNILILIMLLFKYIWTAGD